MPAWLDGYEHDPEPGAGHSPLPGNRKLILHTTETGPGTLDTVRSWWRGGFNQWSTGLPHFIAEGDRYVQLLPLDTCAYTSVGGPDNANKTGTPIQVEIVHRAGEPWSDTEYEALGKWVADLIRAGVDLDLDQCPRFYGPADGIRPYLASAESPVRQIITNQFGGFARFNGICGHQHLRGNDHWDPGPIDMGRVCSITRRYLDGNTGDEIDMTAKDEILTEIRQTKDWTAAMLANVNAHTDEKIAALAGQLAETKQTLADMVRFVEGNLTKAISAVEPGEGGAVDDQTVAAALGRIADSFRPG